MQKLKFIVSPNAGDGLGAKAVPKICRFMEKRKLDYSVEVADRAGMTKNIAARALQEDYEKIIAVGGDGTVNEVAACLAETDAALGVIPAGFGNDFARCLHMPSNIDDACGIIVDGAIKKIDVGKVNGQYFVNTVGLGLDGVFVHLSVKKRGEVSSFARYFENVVKFIPFYRGMKIRAEFDGEVVERDTLIIVIGNGSYEAHGFPFLPDAKPDDGWFDVCMIGPLGFLQKLRHACLIRMGRHGRSPMVEFRKAKKINVDCREELLGHMDGEPIKGQPYKIEIVPGALRVIVRGPE